jgi:vacuolar-type H+-ATPase catalytic subunit A/Vma1
MYNFMMYIVFVNRNGINFLLQTVGTCTIMSWYVISGIQRPLEEINKLTQSIYIPKGINTPALDRQKKWEFEPYGSIRVSLSY